MSIEVEKNYAPEIGSVRTAAGGQQFAKIRKVMETWQVGDAFVVDEVEIKRQNVYIVARQMGQKVRVIQCEDGRMRAIRAG